MVDVVGNNLSSTKTSLNNRLFWSLYEWQFSTISTGLT